VRVQLPRPHVGDSERGGAQGGLVPWYAHVDILTHLLTHSLHAYEDETLGSPLCASGRRLACMSPPLPATPVCGRTHSSRAWSAVALVGTFNCMDFLGRWVLRWEVLVWKKPELLWVSEWSVVQSIAWTVCRLCAPHTTTTTIATTGCSQWCCDWRASSLSLLWPTLTLADSNASARLGAVSDHFT